MWQKKQVLQVLTVHKLWKCVFYTCIPWCLRMQPPLLHIVALFHGAGHGQLFLQAPQALGGACCSRGGVKCTETACGAGWVIPPTSPFYSCCPKWRQTPGQLVSKLLRQKPLSHWEKPGGESLNPLFPLLNFVNSACWLYLRYRTSMPSSCIMTSLTWMFVCCFTLFKDSQLIFDLFFFYSVRPHKG